jgi:hypothetical protein
MTNEEMKTIYANAGLAEADIKKIDVKYDFGKVTEIIEAAHNPKEAFESIHAFYPELDVEKMQEQMDFIQDQINAAFNGEKTEVPLELTEKELDMVTGGGSIGAWLGQNWRRVTAAAVAGVIAGAACAVGGGYIGSVFGPAGIVVGAVVGGVIGAGMGGFYGWKVTDPKVELSDQPPKFPKIR